MPRRPGVLLLAASAILLAAASRKRAVEPPHALDARRSLVVTDQAILDGFSFERVMNAIVARSGSRTTALRLYQQLFDTQNAKPGLLSAESSHCDDFLIDGRPSFNGLPRRCPTPEGPLAKSNPFTGDHIPLALVNRFDLAPADGRNCGQYRIIFAKKSNATFTRVHFIFEAVLPNPNPSEGIAACRPVAQFWADLSNVNSTSERRAKLDSFFFTGMDGFDPVIDPDHFSAVSGGGIRTMHNANAPLGNRFYQFRLAKRGDQLMAVPDVLQNMPYGRFFDATYDTETARRFRDAFVANVGHLAIADENLFFMNIPREFLLAESNPGESELDVVFEIPFLASQLTTEGRAFSSRISSELRKSGSRLSPTDIVKRANQLSCTGCHFFRGNVGELEFYQQISESIIETGEAGPRFAISKTMRDVFVPHRMEVLGNFLKSGMAPPGPNATIGGPLE
ncbi:MAG TPA: hypothetical protein VER58_08205 [Thermoanaerobaculia bacterium]|nr:hypothetical protein [Thermoanaerobaculia bacterium]